MTRLTGKIAIVTGAGSGIGRASAELFAAEGASVVCADRSGAEESVAAAIGGLAVHVDVTDQRDVDRMIHETLDRFGRIDVLFNNAGVGGRAARQLHETDDDYFEHQVALHLRGVFMGMRAAIPVMLQQGGGAIVNTASAAGLVGMKGMAVYSAVKSAVVGLTKSAALDYAEQRIRINAICPGIVFTALSEARGFTLDTPRPEQPVGRYGRVEELAAAALFLASDESSFVTGVAMPVDGGYTAR